MRIQAKGDVFRSGRAVLRGIRVLGYDAGAEDNTSANRWTQPFVNQYMHALQETFSFQKRTMPVHSIAWDAPRLPTPDSTASIVYSHALQIAG